MAAFSLEYSIDIDPDTSVVYVKAYGQWKKENVVNYRRDFQIAIAPLLDRPWAKFVDLTNLKNSRDDAIPEMSQHFQWGKENNATLSIYVLNNVSVFRQLNEAIRKGGTKQTSFTFRTHAEAEKYLKENWINKDKDSLGSDN